jgi:hypothetical protein
VDKLPKIFNPEAVDYQLLLAYYEHKYGKTVKPVNRRSEKATVPKSTLCPRCGAPHQYIYNKPLALRCSYCGCILTPKKDRKHFRIHKGNFVQAIIFISTRCSSASLRYSFKVKTCTPYVQKNS